MFNVGGGEIIVILLIALIVLGPDKLPNTARQVGRFMGEIRRMSNGFQQELRDAMTVNLDGDSGPGAASPSTGSASAAAPEMPPTAAPGSAGTPPILPPAAPAPSGPPAAGAGPVQVDGPSGSFS